MAFKKKIWVNVPDISNLPSIPDGQDSLARFDAENMNRIEDGIEENMSSIEEIASSTENWTFTLEDGSTVTKAVYVG